MDGLTVLGLLPRREVRGSCPDKTSGPSQIWWALACRARALGDDPAILETMNGLRLCTGQCANLCTVWHRAEPRPGRESCWPPCQASPSGNRCLEARVTASSHPAVPTPSE